MPEDKVICGECGAEVAVSAETCPICETSLKKAKPMEDIKVDVEQPAATEVDLPTSSDEPERGSPDSLPQLVQWEMEGIDVSSLHEKLKGAEEPGQMLEDFARKVSELKGVQREVEALEVPEGLDDAVSRVLALMSDPVKLDELKSAVADLVEASGKARRRAEISSYLEIASLKPLAEETLAHLEKGDSEAVEKGLKKLKKEKMAIFFTDHIQADLDSTPVKVRKIRVLRMPPKDVKSPPSMPTEAFVLHKSGKIVAFKSCRPDAAAHRQEIAQRAVVITNQVKRLTAENRMAFLKISFGSERMLIHPGENFAIALIVNGKEHEMAPRIMGRLAKLVEKSYAPSVRDWLDGKAKLSGIERYAGALLHAFTKFDEGGEAT